LRNAAVHFGPLRLRSGKSATTGAGKKAEQGDPVCTVAD